MRTLITFVSAGVFTLAFLAVVWLTQQTGSYTPWLWTILAAGLVGIVWRHVASSRRDKVDRPQP